MCTCSGSKTACSLCLLHMMSAPAVFLESVQQPSLFCFLKFCGLVPLRKVGIWHGFVYFYIFKHVNCFN